MPITFYIPSWIRQVPKIVVAEERELFTRGKLGNCGPPVPILRERGNIAQKSSNLFVIALARFITRPDYRDQPHIGIGGIRRRKSTRRWIISCMFGANFRGRRTKSPLSLVTTDWRVLWAMFSTNFSRRAKIEWSIKVRAIADWTFYMQIIWSLQGTRWV